MRKVIVTGGAGFIGSNIARALLEKGFEVHIIDNLSLGKKENIPPKAIFHKGDIRNATWLEKTFKSINSIHCIFHCAALPSVQSSIDDPLASHENNINGTMNVLSAARKLAVRRVVYSASCSAYGDQDKMPLKETMLPSPKSPYAAQKYYGEVACKVFSEVYGLPTVSLRYFNVYGPGQNPNGAYPMVIAKFIAQKRNGKPAMITGDGNQTRDFIHISDVVNANLLAMESENVGKGEIINVGYGKNVSINQISKIIGGKAVHVPARLEPHDTLADNSLAKKLLGWKPLTSIEDGIKDLLLKQD